MPLRNGRILQRHGKTLPGLQHIEIEMAKPCAGAAVFSGMVTAIMLIASLSASGTWLDPRVWSGSHVPGDSITSRMENGAWVIDAAVSASPSVFLALWVCLIACLLIAKKCHKSMMGVRRRR